MSLENFNPENHPLTSIDGLYGSQKLTPRKQQGTFTKKFSRMKRKICQYVQFVDV